MILALGFVAASAIFIYGNRAQNEEAQKEEKSIDVAALAASVEALQTQLKALGVVPIVASPVEQIAGPTGPEPSFEQVLSAVQTYLLANPPPSGRAPTDAEVAAAVVAFCGANNGCRGLVGASGALGDTGPEGLQGAPGEPPSDAQVLAAVQAYCDAHGGCAGPAGPSVDVCDPPPGYNPLIDPDQGGWMCTTTTTAP